MREASLSKHAHPAAQHSVPRLAFKQSLQPPFTYNPSGSLILTKTRQKSPTPPLHSFIRFKSFSNR
ncbi:hypothetical protein NC653_005078 [Populus alba x Populus x berolinensis]|uniref:Uncharacterized protein n=1 Tax=Populus alba x Populus x berolinensis TaxID=444605 RepID=A0AAD6RBG6_9ROSI|nr:hypothetical protein NC653_005078 [Populus alba x Populus x berolinensis]